MHPTDATPVASTCADPERSDADGRPGALHGVVTLTLETRQAQRLVKGRPANADKPAIIGLIGFARLLRKIWHGSRADDPYADWWLVRVHGALESADDRLQGSLEGVQRLLAATEGIAVTSPTSVKPVRTPLRFSNPYAFRGAQLLATYDRLVRLLLTARYIGQLTPTDSERKLGQHARALRHAFLSPVGYHLTGVIRADVHQGTARSAHAVACMGEVPADILDGTQRAPYAPVGPLPTSSWARHTMRQTTPSSPLSLTKG